jgi:hypothetical protein
MSSIRFQKAGNPESIDDCSLPVAEGAIVYSYQDRIKYLTVSTIAVVILVIARILHPSPSGVGTHEQLGLPSCPFLHFTGIPCPSCGLTTSFAHAARLDFLAALITQPFGLLAFCLTVLSIPASLYFMRHRMPWSEIIHLSIINRIIYGLTATYFSCWVYKIIVMKSLLP